MAGVLRLLTDALPGNPKQLEWSSVLQVAFEVAKAALAAAMPLHHPDDSAKLSLHVNASSLHIGSVFSSLMVSYSSLWPSSTGNC